MQLWQLLSVAKNFPRIRRVSPLDSLEILEQMIAGQSFYLTMRERPMSLALLLYVFAGFKIYIQICFVLAFFFSV